MSTHFTGCIRKNLNSLSDPDHCQVEIMVLTHDGQTSAGTNMLTDYISIRWMRDVRVNMARGRGRHTPSAQEARYRSPTMITEPAFSNSDSETRHLRLVNKLMQNVSDCR